MGPKTQMMRRVRRTQSVHAHSSALIAVQFDLAINAPLDFVQNIFESLRHLAAAAAAVEL